jgi:hypothetical protein
MLFRAAAHDIYVARSLLKTMHFIMHPLGLFHPRIIIGMLLSLRRKNNLSLPTSSS